MPVTNPTLRRASPMWRWRLLFVFCAGTPALFNAAQAAIYYVSSSAAGSANQGTLENPWTSLATVSATTFAPGDQILLKRGDTWTGETLKVPGSGSPGSPITFGAYGSGALPVIDRNSNAGECIAVTNKSYITIQDIEVRKSAQALYALHSHHVTVQRVTARDSAANGIIVRGGFENHVLDCTAISNAQAGIFFKGDATDHLRDSSIQRCFIDGDNGDTNDGIALHDAATATEVLGENFLVKDNLSINCGEQGYDITSGGNILIENNVSRGNEEGALIFGHAAHNVTVRYHRSENEPTVRVASFKVGAPDVTIEYSTFISHPTVANPVVWVTSTSSTNFPEVQPENLTLRNNVFVWNNTTTSDDFFVLNSGAYPLNISKLTVKNNIFVSRTDKGGVMRFTNPSYKPDHAGFDFDHNLYYGSTATQWVVAGTPAPYNFATYRSTFGKDTNGVQADPQFVDLANGDFHLSSTSSPAYNAGQNVGISTDPDGVSIPQGGARDIGAYEFPAAIAAPTNLTATAVAPHEIQLAWTDNSTDETAFRLQRKEGAAGAYADTTPATVAANTVTFNDTGVADNTTYFYQVRAENSLGASVWSNTASATTPEADTTAPEITSLTATPDHLWPANHKMVAVTLAATATDNKDPSPTTKILSVTSSEVTNGQGDGNTAIDWEITGDLTLNLRAERSGNGPGRVYTVTVQSTDSSGNSGTAAILIPVAHNNDAQAPTVALTTPADGALLGGTVALAATATDNDGVIGVQFKVDGVNLGVEDTTAPFSLSWGTSTATPGAHTLTAVARDAAGNTTTSAAVNVTVLDQAAPTVSITAPDAGNVAGTVAVSANASDNVGVAGVQFKLDGDNLGTEDTTAPYGISWDTATATNGSHTLNAVARDAAGNTTTSAGVSVTVNNAPIVIDFNDYVSGATTSAGDSVGSIGLAGASGNNGVRFIANAPGDWVEFTMPTTAIPSGTYSVTVRARVANSMGTYQLSIDGVNRGAPQNLYSASGAFTVRDLGTAQLSGSNLKFRFACTGKDPASSNYTLTLDTLTLTP